MTPLQILRGARELLAKPERWTKGASARDAKGQPCPADSPKACSFCILGALEKVFADYGDAASVLRELTPHYNLGAFFNDLHNTTHADILNLLDRGIAELEGVKP